LNVGAGSARIGYGKKRGLGGFTLIELMVAIAILMLLTGWRCHGEIGDQAAKERELRCDLREMRDAIDRYKDASDRLLLREKATTADIPSRSMCW